MFHDCHKNGIDQDEKVITRFHNILTKKFTSWPGDVLMLFAKTYTFIRLKFLNHQLKAGEAKAKMRQFKKQGQFMF